MAYRFLVDAAPFQPVDEPITLSTSAALPGLDPGLLDGLWEECRPDEWGLQRSDFDRIVLVVAVSQNCGLEPRAVASKEQQAAFFRSLKLADVVLAKACAAGNERAWERFMALYGQQLTRAAIAISGNETVGRDLADSFYAELYGLNARDGERKCPLDSYKGRGSLIGWLRTTLAQRFVDHYRRRYREQALDEDVHDVAAPDSNVEPEVELLARLRQAVRAALSEQPAEERFLLAAYYVDQRTLAEIALVLRVHEATISRRLRRATETVRKHLLRNLQKTGMTRTAAEEALGTDPRDLDLKMDLKKLLQSTPPEPIQVQAGEQAARGQPVPDRATASEAHGRASLSETKTPE